MEPREWKSTFELEDGDGCRSRIPCTMSTDQSTKIKIKKKKKKHTNWNDVLGAKLVVMLAAKQMVVLSSSRMEQRVEMLVAEQSGAQREFGIESLKRVRVRMISGKSENLRGKTKRTKGNFGVGNLKVYTK